MESLVAVIQERVKTLNPAWLEAFKVFLAKKVNGVLLWETKMEILIEAILNGTWKGGIKNNTTVLIAANDELFWEPDSKAA